MKWPRILLITNIINPYRQHLFNAWADNWQIRGGMMFSAFMARGEPMRRWKPEDYPLHHAHKFYWGLHVPVPRLGRPVHCNPGIWLNLCRQRWDAVIVGGYDNLTSVGAAFLPLRDSVKLLWSETNPVSQQRGGGTSRFIKRRIVDQYDGYLVPGKWAKEFILGLTPCAANKPFFTLPNVIREDTFARVRTASPQERMNLRQRMRISPEHRVLLSIGRLDPKKGVDRVLQAFRGVTAPMTYLVVGEGTIQREIEELARQCQHIDVRLLGYQNENNVVELLKVADGFILASLYDPWPLVVAEAITAGLPILISDRVGNARDLVQAGENGWCFNPEDESDIRHALDEFCTCKKELLDSYRNRSGNIADAKLNTQRIVANVNDGIVELLEQRRDKVV